MAGWRVLKRVCLVCWNGMDYVEVSMTVTAAVVRLGHCL